MSKDLVYLEDVEELMQDSERLRIFVNGLNRKYIDNIKQLKTEYINSNIQMSKDELLLRQEFINDFIKYIESRD